MPGTLPPGGGSSMPAGKQVKKIGDGGKQNVPYFNQQSGSPQPGPTTEHPLAPTLISDQQQQQDGRR